MPISSAITLHDFPTHPFTTPPRWSRNCRRWTPGLSVHLIDWLFDSGSLTRRLRQTCTDPKQFRVRVLRQGWSRPSRDEAQVLRLRLDAWAWTREVQLLNGERVWVFARTLIPATTLQGRGRRLTQLGNRPLGEVLFTDPGVCREPVEVARIGAGQRLHHRAFVGFNAPPDAIWGRRSIFRIDGRPLLVCEIFLPDLPIAAPVAHRTSLDLI